MIKLPEPAHRGPSGTGDYFSSYTKEQMLQFRRDALEEATKLCYTLHSNDQTNILYAAKEIRKLKDET